MKIAAKNPERGSFFSDFPLGAHAGPAKEGDGWAPALQGVLQQKRSDRDRESVPFATHRKTQAERKQSHGSGVGLEQALDIPFAIQFPQPLLDAGRARAGSFGEMFPCDVGNPCVRVLGGRIRNAASSCGKEAL